MIRVPDTSRCPRGHRCESCGAAAGDDLAVFEVPTAVGLVCLTLCPTCAASQGDPPITVGTAMRLRDQHEQHIREAGGPRFVDLDL